MLMQPLGEVRLGTGEEVASAVPAMAAELRGEAWWGAGARSATLGRLMNTLNPRGTLAALEHSHLFIQIAS